jgi:beta-ureidopropionase
MKQLQSRRVRLAVAVLITIGTCTGGAYESTATADEPISQARNQLVRVVTISQEGLDDESGKSMLNATLTRLDRAAAFRPDIVCLPETFTRGEPETVPGATTDRLSAWAKQHRSYVICPLNVRDGERIFNSAILIDRGGEVVGRYDKIRPTENELKKSICPGAVDPPVFETDFGLIGVQICFDVNWHAQWRTLKKKGAKIIFFASAYPAARQAKSHAWMHQCFVVSSTMTRTASIYDITGDQIATTGKYQHWAGAVLPVGKRLFEIDFHVSKMRKITEKYGSKVRVSWYHDDDLVSVASLDPNLTVNDLIKEYELTPHPAYIERAELAQDKERPSAE